VTLDPIHVEAIARLAGSVAETADDSDHEQFATTVWEQWLDPLVDSRGQRMIEPLGDQQLRHVDIEDIALVDRPFPTVHGIDSGTINPTAFKNGLVLDLAHAAMGVEPSQVSTHRKRTIVATAHTNDRTQVADGDWVDYDAGHSRYRLIRAPQVNKYAEAVVHALALYFAEGGHALEHADTVEDLLILDGPLYPKEILTWRDRTPELEELTYEARPKRVLEQYVRLVERFVDRGVPIAGFVKNPSARVITSTIANKEIGFEAPWPDDTAFFTAARTPPPARRRCCGRRDSREPPHRRTHLHLVVRLPWRPRRDNGRRGRRAGRRPDPRSGVLRSDVLYRLRPATRHLLQA